MATAGDNSQLLNTLVRMVVPMRREFGRSLDIQNFLADSGYAEVVLTEALASQDPRLRDYATYVKARLMGARTASPSAPSSKAVPTPAPAPAAPTEREELSEAEMRARVLRKYTTGLR